MKKLNKIGTIALSTAVLASSIFAVPATIGFAKADTATDGKVMTIEKLASNYSLDENGKITIPKAKAVNGGTVDTKIYPLYSTEEVDTTVSGDSLQFVPEYSAYRVEYSLDGVVKSFVINVELVNPTLSFKENDKVYLPGTTAKNTTLIIPYINVLDEDKEALKNLDGNAYTDAEIVAKTQIKVYAPDGTLLTGTEADAEKPIGTIEESDTVYSGTIKYKKFTPKALGTYTVKYLFQADTTTQAELTKEVKVVNSFETTRNISFTLSKALGTPVIGEEFTLPTPTVNDTTNNLNGIEAYTEIEVKCKKADGTTENVEVTGFKFTPTVEGDYIITYKVSDLFGNKATNASYQITNVKDTKAPYDIKLVNNYAFDATNLEDLEDYSYALQSRMAVSTDGDETTYMIIPAVYAKDNVTSLQNLVVKRTVKSYSATTTSTTIDTPFNEVALYKVENAGTYTVTYTIEDKENGNKTEKSYQVIVQENYIDEVPPEITFDNAIAQNAKAGDTIVFNKPTAIDYRDTNKNTGDTRLNLKTYYYVDSDINNKKLVNEYSKNTSKFAIEIPSDFSGSKITILTIAIDDEGREAQATHEITVVNDTEVPEFVTVGDFESEYFQGSEITIPKVVVSDNYVTSVSANIEVVNAQGQRVLVNGLTNAIEGGDLVLENAKFYAVQSGEYTIKYLVRDGNDNISIFTHKINVTKTSEPVIYVDKDEINAELGDEIDLNIFHAWDEGVAISPSDIVISGVAVDSNNMFKAQSIGTWTATFTYNYVVGATNLSVSKDVVINVNDTTAPTIKFNGNAFDDVAYKKNVEISIPAPIVTDNSNEQCDLVIKIVHDGEEVDYDTTTNKFTPSKDGNYTITYTATDVYGNSSEKSFSITVGDKTGPVIDLGDESVNAPSTMKKGSTLTLDTSKINIYDEMDRETDFDLKGENVTITLRDGNNNVVANTSTSPNGFSYKLDTVGSYTLTYTAKDANGNKTTVTKTIEVSDDTIAETKVGDVGMALAIIVALVVLGAVIFFVFKPEGKKGGKPTSKKKD